MNAPTDAECNDQAVAFDILRAHVKTLDQLLHNMADIDDMMDELDDAAKKAGKADDWQAAACRLSARRAAWRGRRRGRARAGSWRGRRRR